jgi:hypothetical protein
MSASRPALRLLSLSALLTVLGLTPLCPGTDSVKSTPTGPERFHNRLLEIARTYKQFGRVDGPARWSPFDCRMPPPSVARLSASADEDTHGRKLYFLFAKDRDKYLKLEATTPTGQALVKESWFPDPVKDDQPARVVLERRTVSTDEKTPEWLRDMPDHYLPYVRRDGKLYHAKRKAGLFVMYKTDPAAPDTDRGWVYGTLTADGKTVTAAGRVASCMGCHVKAERDRLFGLSKVTDHVEPNKWD